ncbi:MAG: ABC transporter ATP-binding protein [Chitinophagales bacterium]|nr:ABC transporter ATP-binding protein [Chitinophagales bacterium]
MSKNVISVKGLSKRYRIGVKDESNDTLTGAVKDFLTSPIKRFRNLNNLASFKDKEETDVIWAVKDVSFDVNDGEVLGIIGKNGAGKSTLLKILSRITEPTDGKIEIEGRVSSLLEVGTGFHPELTGRENVYLNGTILGMKKKEIDRKFDEIVGFSEVEKFIDTPVKRYSSGMKVRLGFAVAAHLDPEVLIIDEVLAVGDADFQKRCLGKMKDVADEGRTVIFVSHNLPLVKGLCPRSILMRNGQIMFDGNSEDAITNYLSVAGHVEKTNHIQINENGFTGEIVIENASFADKNVLRIGDDLLVKVTVTTPRDIRNLACGIGIHRNQQCITKLHTFYQLDKVINLKKGETITYEILWKNNNLVAGLYQLELGVLTGNDGLLNIRDMFSFELVPHDFYGNGQLPKLHMGFYLSEADWNYKITS